MTMIAAEVPQRSTFTHALACEWTKLRSLRSTWWTTLVAVVLGLGTGLLTTAAQGHVYLDAKPEGRIGFDPASASLSSVLSAELVIGVLGVLVITSEYATRMIDTSLTVVPRRSRMLAAKITVLAVFTMVVGTFVGFTSFLVGQFVLARLEVPTASLGDPAALRAVLGAGLYLAVFGLLGLAFGTIMRNTAGAISLLVAITLLVRLLSSLLPESGQRWMNAYWPTTAGERILTTVPNPALLSPWAGLGVLTAFVVVCHLIGFAVLRSRDA